MTTSAFAVAALIAIATWLIGSIVLAVAIRRTRLMPRWVAIALSVVTLFAVVGASFGTSLLIGIFQVVVGLRIARAANARATTPTGRRNRPEAGLAPSASSRS